VWLIGKKGIMDTKTVLIMWSIFAASIIFFHIRTVKDHIPLSECHLAEIKWYYDKPMCTECKLFCEIKK
tara:strand:+ start:2737 stop:2943 length:207 start_codon:yes stop_codon:yes gene_type:complete